MIRQMKTTITEGEEILGCRGCFYFNPRSTTRCNRIGKREVGKFGKCLNKKKSHF